MEEKLEDMMFVVDGIYEMDLMGVIDTGQEDWDTVMLFLQELPTLKVGDEFSEGPITRVK